MIRGILNTSAPVIASAGLYGITDSELGKTLLIIMAFAVILNQLWSLIERILDRVKPKPADLSGLAGVEICTERHNKIEGDLAALRGDNARQDRVGAEQFQTISQSLVEMKHELSAEFDKLEAKADRQTTGLHKRVDDILRAVSRLEGKVE